MATPDPDEVLRSTTGKSNFQRVARLLISGGTALLREIFDQLCPPSNLPTILNNPATKKQLKSANLTKPQRGCLYPSPGVYGKSENFDVTLLFRLLKTICNLIPPATGWDALPTCTDHSLAADLARIKYYRNSVYGHVNQKMEITDEEFPQLWQEISDTLIRIAGQISPAKKTEWQEAIANFLKDPLTAEDERNVEELMSWYRNDVDVKNSLEELKVTTKEGMERFETSLKGAQEAATKEVQEGIERLETRVQGGLEGSTHVLETAVREEAQDIKDQLRELLQSTKEVQDGIERLKPIVPGELKGTTHVLETAVREEAQEIKDQLGEMHQSVDRLSSSTSGSQAAGGVLSAPTVVLDELRRRTEQLKKLRTELKNQFIAWKPIRKCHRALITELATKLSISSSIRNVGTATAYATVGAVIVPIMVAMLLYSRFGARFGFAGDAGRDNTPAVAIGAGVIGAAVGAAGGVGGFSAAVGAIVGFAGGAGGVVAAFGAELIGVAIGAGAIGAALGAAVGTAGGDNVETVVGAVFGSAVGALVVGFVGVRFADGDDTVHTGVRAVFGSAVGAAVGSALGAAGIVAAVGTIVGIAVEVTIGFEIALKFGGVSFLVGAVVFALLGALVGIFVGVLVGASLWLLVFIAVFLVLEAAGASKAAEISVFLVGLAVSAVIGAVNVAVAGIIVGLEIGSFLGASFDVVVNAVVSAAVCAGVGTKVATAVQKYVMNTYRMKRVHHAIDKDRKTYQELKAKEDNLGKCVADFAFFCCQHIGSVLSSELLEDEFRFLLDILRNAAAEGAAPRSTFRHEDVNIHSRVSNLLKQLQPSTSDQEALTTIEKILDELQECPDDGEIQRRIIDFMETKFAETCTSQL